MPVYLKVYYYQLKKKKRRMVKFYCDACGEEIKDPNQIGNFKITENSFAFIKHQKEEQTRMQEFIFCIDCARKIREYFQKLKAEEK